MYSNVNAPICEFRTFILDRAGKPQPIETFEIKRFDGWLEGVVTFGDFSVTKTQVEMFSDEIFSLWQNLERFAVEPCEAFRFRNATQPLAWELCTDGRVSVGSIDWDVWAEKEPMTEFSEVHFSQIFELQSLLRGIVVGAIGFWRWVGLQPAFGQHYYLADERVERLGSIGKGIDGFHNF